MKTSPRKVKKEWPCKHIDWFEEFVTWFSNTLPLTTHLNHIPQNWNFCPICGATRPKPAGKEKGKQ